MRELLSASKTLFGTSVWAQPKLRAIFWFNGLLNHPQLPLRNRAAAACVARRLQCADPEHLGILMWPLVDARWRAPQRLEQMGRHYSEVEAIGPAVQLELDQVKTLLQFGAGLSALSVRLERQGFFRREGQLALSVFHAEERIYSVAFLLGRADGKRLAFIGAIQGVKQSEDSSLYKTITKDAHGLRPRDLAISLFLAFCKALAVDAVYAVQDAHRQHRHSYFGRAGKAEVFANYDAVWEEQDGRATATGFYELPVGIRMKEPESIPSKKRSMYKKRYALLEAAQTAFAAALAQDETVWLADPA